MDCQFCNVERATHFRVPTRYGVATGLCAECYAEHARLLHRTGRANKQPSGSARSDAAPGQLPLFPENETSGPAMAARFCASFPLDQSSQGVSNDRR
jgi:hypothetical protein